MIRCKEIEKLIKEYDERAYKAERNYQDSGNPSYYKTKCRNEDLASALRGYLEAENHIRTSQRLRSFVLSWGETVSEILDKPYLTKDQKQEKINNLLSEIKHTAFLEKRGK